ncbi:sialate:O-sulfotransferase 1-like [Apostichopus japonicus]|uniref:sialate:O-sulfotransferase 1-like n=1 Tax=Stichopus japonicus TaxID=307972 RepID=UPI003AB4F28E
MMMISPAKVICVTLVIIFLVLLETFVPRLEDRNPPRLKLATLPEYDPILDVDEQVVSEIAKTLDQPFDDSVCHKMLAEVTVAPNNSMPLMALASFPRCGNSWTRKMLHIATGIYTGSVYELQGITGALQNTVCVKTHEFDTTTIQRFEAGAILLMRNPTHSLISEFFRSHKEANPLLTEEDGVALIKNPIQWHHFVTWRVERWRSTNISWIQNSKRLLVIFYEDLTENPVRELIKMLQFLRQPILPDRVRCAVRLNAWQNQKHIDFQVPFPDMLHRYILDVNETLKTFHYRPLPTYDLSFESRR